MSNKGKVFSASDLPQGVLRRIGPERAAAIAAEQTERNKIVAYDGETPLIAEELDQRALNKLSDKARRVAGMMLGLEPDIRKEIVGAFDAKGVLKRPFKRA